MLRKHMGFAVEREPKKPVDLIEQATIYNTEHEVCIPPTSFKNGMLDASLPIKGLVKKRLMGMIWVEGGAIRLKYKTMEPRMDVVRLPNKMPDIRFRPMFMDWSCRMLIGYSETLQVEVIIDLLSRAGRLGVGEFRPGRNGTFGTYKVTRSIDSQKEIEEIRAENAFQLEPLIIPEWAMNVEFDNELMTKIANSKNTNTGDLDDEDLDGVVDGNEKSTKKTSKRGGRRAAA
jgi:hypothetical protein